MALGMHPEKPSSVRARTCPDHHYFSLETLSSLLILFVSLFVPPFSAQNTGISTLYRNSYGAPAEDIKHNQVEETGTFGSIFPFDSREISWNWKKNKLAPI